MTLWHDEMMGELVETDVEVVDQCNIHCNTVILGYCFKCKQSFVGKHECEEIPKMKSISEWMFTIRCRRGFVMCPDCALHNKCRRFKKHRRYLEGK